MKKVLIALNSSKDLYDFIVRTSINCGMEPIEDDSINVRSLLLMHVEQYSPDIVVMSDILLGDEKNETPKERDTTLLQIMKILRQLRIRVIFISLSHPPRKEGDGFLGELVHLGIYDIWYQRTIDPEKFAFHFADENRLDYHDVDYLSDMSKGFTWAPLPPPGKDSPSTDNEEATSEDLERAESKWNPFPEKSQPKNSVVKEPVYIEKVVKEVIRVNESVTLKPLLIVVGSLNATGGAGASTVCHAIATVLSKIGPYTVVVEAFTQGRAPQMLEYLGQNNIPQLPDGQVWKSWMRQLKEEGNIHHHWDQYGIRWAPLDPGCPEYDLTQEENLRFISLARQHPFVVVDLGKAWRSPFAEYWLLQADVILGVTDCSNSRLWSAVPSVQFLVEKYKERFRVCLNRYNDTYKEIKDYVHVFLEKEEVNPYREQVPVEVAIRLPDLGTYFSDREWRQEPIDNGEILEIIEVFLEQYIDRKAFLQKENLGQKITRTLGSLFSRS